MGPWAADAEKKLNLQGLKSIQTYTKVRSFDGLAGTARSSCSKRFPFGIMLTSGQRVCGVMDSQEIDESSLPMLLSC